MSKIKDLKKYYEPRVSWSDEDGVFIVRFPELPGCSTHGKTREEAIANAEDALESHLSAIESVEGILPTPLAMLTEKKFAARIKAAIYRVAEEDASKQGVSFNAYLNDALEAFVHRSDGRIVSSATLRQASTKKRA